MHALKICHLLAEGLSFPDVIRGQVQGALGQADTPRADDGTTFVKRFHYQRETLAFGSEAVCFRDKTVAQVNGRGGYTPRSQFAFAGTYFKPGHAFFQNKNTDAAMA